MLLFGIFLWLMLFFIIFCSLFQDYHLYAVCSFTYLWLAPCSEITNNRGSLITYHLFTNPFYGSVSMHISAFIEWPQNKQKIYLSAFRPSTHCIMATALPSFHPASVTSWPDHCGELKLTCCSTTAGTASIPNICDKWNDSTSPTDGKVTIKTICSHFTVTWKEVYIMYWSRHDFHFPFVKSMSNMFFRDIS